MRRWTLIVIAGLVAAGCGKEETAQDSAQADQALAQSNLDTNDLTAIDAASGADSNMAADIDYANMVLNEDEGGNAGTGNASTPRRPSSRSSSPPASAPAEERPAATNDTAPPEPEDGAN